MSHQAFLLEPNLHLLNEDRLLIFYRFSKFYTCMTYFYFDPMHLLKVSFSGFHLIAVLGIQLFKKFGVLLQD